MSFTIIQNSKLIPVFRKHTVVVLLLSFCFLQLATAETASTLFPRQASTVYLQIAAYGSMEMAQQKVDALQARLNRTVFYAEEVVRNPAPYKVLVGPFANTSEAKAYQRQHNLSGYPRNSENLRLYRLLAGRWVLSSGIEEESYPLAYEFSDKGQPQTPVARTVNPEESLYYIQTGAYKNQQNVVDAVSALQPKVTSDRIYYIQEGSSSALRYKVLVGPFLNKEQAETYRRQQGIKGFSRQAKNATFFVVGRT